MSKRQIDLKGLPVTLQKIGEEDFLSLTDIARHAEGPPDETLRNWIRTAATLQFLETWEELHNPNFKPVDFHRFRRSAEDNRLIVTPQKFIAETDAVGLISKSGRYGGTWAHSDIALQFCYWLSPRFQVYLFKEFQKLKREEAERLSLEWHVERVTDLLDEARNWMDSIPGQKTERNRLKKLD